MLKGKIALFSALSVVLAVFISVLLVQPAQSTSHPDYSQITVNNQIVQYMISGGTISSVKYNGVLPALDIVIKGSSAGSVTLDIPRNLLDYKDRFLHDAPFIITVNGTEVKPDNEQDQTYSRNLTLRFDKGTSIVEIIGNGHANLKAPTQPSYVKITNPNPHVKDLFGTSVSTMGGDIVIGVPNAYSDNATRGGMVYLYDTKGNMLLSIADPDDNDGDQFGRAVASLGDVIMVGAPTAQVSGLPQGKVYVFDNAGRLTRTILNPDPASGRQFGYSLAVQDGNIIIGSPTGEGNQTKPGSAYVFDGSSSKMLLAIRDPDAMGGDLFGFSVNPIQNEIAVGAPNSNFGAPEAGSVFLFDSASGNLVRILRNPDPDNRTAPNQGSDQFGFSLASTGKYLVVGERGGDIKRTVNGREEYMVDQSGNVRIYDIQNGTNVLTINDPTPVQNNDFGVSVATSSDKILIGMDHDDTSGFDSGSAYLYDFSGKMLGAIQNPEPNPPAAETMGNYFGSSTAFLNGYLVVGSPGDNTWATNAGAVYIIEENSTKPILQNHMGLGQCMDCVILHPPTPSYG